MAPKKDPEINDDELFNDKAAWTDYVTEATHTTATSVREDNRLPPLASPKQRKEETPDKASVRRWFGRPTAPEQKFDDVRAARFLDYYARTGRKSDGALYAGVHASTIVKWENDSPEFRELVEEAHGIYLNMLEAEALRRGAEGVLEPIVAGKDPEIVTYVRRFSDKLLEGLLRKADPVGWGNRDGVNVNVHAGVLVAPPPVTPETTHLPIEDIEDDDDNKAS